MSLALLLSSKRHPGEGRDPLITQLSLRRQIGTSAASTRPHSVRLHHGSGFRRDDNSWASMPKRTDIDSILIIGAGPIVIGQACEFDYSGVQACKALREEGYRIVLVNSNPATIMTDPELADATYIEPITPEIVERIIARERPDALLPTMGGQTALNTAMALSRSGALARYGVELIGANEEAIAKAEDRLLFRQAMDRIGLESPKSRLVTSVDAALRGARPSRPAGDHPALLHAGRHRRRHRLQHRGVRGARPRRPARLADARGAGRGIGARLEGVRARSRPRPRRQLHHRLLDRECRSDGRAYRRLR